MQQVKDLQSGNSQLLGKLQELRPGGAPWHMSHSSSATVWLLDGLGSVDLLAPFVLFAAVLSATGSFKRAASNPKRGAAPAKEALPDPATLGEAAAVGLAQSQHAEQPAEHVRTSPHHSMHVTAPQGHVQSGLTAERVATCEQDGAPPIVAPRIVRGRGRARAGLTARIGR